LRAPVDTPSKAVSLTFLLDRRNLRVDVQSALFDDDWTLPPFTTMHQTSFDDERQHQATTEIE
jgi:hypothetical protein